MAAPIEKVEYLEGELYRPKLPRGGKCGDMVAVRPNAVEYGGKTFLGLLLGAFPVGLGGSLNHESKLLSIRCTGYFPAIFIPERNAIVFDFESWWKPIKSEAQLRDITDLDITDVWYVKALKTIRGDQELSHVSPRRPSGANAMGWNSGYTIFEATVVGAYDLGKLDKDLLRVLMEPYRDTDIDSGGGGRGLLSEDGLDVEEIVLKVMGADSPPKPELKSCSDDEAEEYWEAKGEAFRKVTKGFGW